MVCNLKKFKKNFVFCKCSFSKIVAFNYIKSNGKSFDFYHFLMYNRNVVEKEKQTLSLTSYIEKLTFRKED